MKQPITSVDQLRKLMGEPHDLTAKKIYSQMFPEAVEFIARSPLLFMSTSDAQGQVTVSPKGDASGFVRVVDERTLLIPERPGNKLLHGLGNILESGEIGLIFILPGTEETLRVNGRAALYADEDLCDEFAANGKPAQLIIEVTVRECFFHCAKAFKRSKTWQPESWPEKQKISFGKIIAANTAGNVVSAKAIGLAVDQAVKYDYKKNL